MKSQTRTNITDCINACSIFDPACVGVTYYTQNQTCSMKGKGVNSTFLSSTDTDTDNVYSAIANETQVAPLNETCPYEDNPYVTVQNLTFEILCNRDMKGYGDCMEQSLDAHPLCLGVTWNPNQHNGYGNCFLKTAIMGLLSTRLLSIPR